MASSIENTAPLAPVLSEKYALKWQHTAFCSFFAVMFLMISHAPLQMVGPWKPVRLGSAGWSTCAFGVDDPAIPLSAGMNQPHLSWLTSTLLSATHTRLGDEGVSQLVAMVLFISYLLWARCFFLLSRSKLITAVAVSILFVSTNWFFGDGGPATFGFFCAAMLAWILLPVLMRTRSRETNALDDVERNAELGSPHLWWCVPVLMALWCNLSGTFVVGILMLAAVAVGCAFDSARSHGSAGSFWKTPRFQQSVYLLEVALLATCLHPLGIKIWSSFFATEHNPFWIAAGGDATVDLRSVLGLQVFFAAGLTLWVFRTSRLRISVADVVVVTGLLLATVFNARFIAWTVPMFQLFLIPHLVRGQSNERQTDAVSERQRPDASDERRPLQFAHSLICLLLIWMAFSFSPLSTRLLGGQPRTTVRLYGESVPWGVSQYLAKNSSTGLVWAPSNWSDWIASQSDHQTQLFTSSNVAALPGQVQRDYERVYRGDDSWQRTLERYDVETLIIDKDDQDRLFNVVLREGKSWRIVFESDRAIVLRKLEV